MLIVALTRGFAMDIFTVSMFGHRRIDEIRHLEELLAPVIHNLLRSHPYVSFLVGRNGDFDTVSASVIKSEQKKYGNGTGDLTLVLPYPVANLEYYKSYYDHILIPSPRHLVHPKSAITVKNRWMIDCSDLIIFYLRNDSGGAYEAMKYAKRKNKKIILL